MSSAEINSSSGYYLSKYRSCHCHRGSRRQRYYTIACMVGTRGHNILCLQIVPLVEIRILPRHMNRTFIKELHSVPLYAVIATYCSHNFVCVTRMYVPLCIFLNVSKSVKVLLPADNFLHRYGYILLLHLFIASTYNLHSHNLNFFAPSPLSPKSFRDMCT